MSKRLKSKKNINSSKISRYTKWLKPTSPTKGAILFVIVFSIIGGGYTAFKSFAASNTWGIAPKDITTNSVWFSEHGRDCNGNKGCIDVVRLKSLNDDNANFGGWANMPLYLSPQEFSRSRFARICAFARTEKWGDLFDTYNRMYINWKTSPNNLGTVEILAHKDGFDTEFNMYESKTYEKWCTKWYVTKIPDQTTVTIKRWKDVYPGWGNPIDISSVIFEWQ